VKNQYTTVVPKTSPHDVWGVNVPASLEGKAITFEGAPAIIRKAWIEDLELHVTIETDVDIPGSQNEGEGYSVGGSEPW
jgi:hypothetical protein